MQFQQSTTMTCSMWKSYGLVPPNKSRTSSISQMKKINKTVQDKCLFWNQHDDTIKIDCKDKDLQKSKTNKHTLSIDSKSLCLMPIFSTMASITKSVPLTTPCKSDEPLTRFKTSVTNFVCESPSSRNCFLAKRPRLVFMLFCAFSTNWLLTSTMVTS